MDTMGCLRRDLQVCNQTQRDTTDRAVRALSQIAVITSIHRKVKMCWVHLALCWTPGSSWTLVGRNNKNTTSCPFHSRKPGSTSRTAHYFSHGVCPVQLFYAMIDHNNFKNTHPGVVAHDPVQVVRVKIVHPELERPQSQTIEIASAPQSVHHKPHHEGQVRQERRKPRRHRQAQLHEDILDGNLLCAVVKLAELRQQQGEERIYLLGSQVKSRYGYAGQGRVGVVGAGRGGGEGGGEGASSTRDSGETCWGGYVCVCT